VRNDSGTARAPLDTDEKSSTLYLDHVAKPHRFEHASLLVLDVDPMVEICPTDFPYRFCEGEAGILARKVTRGLEIGEFSSIHVTSVNVVVKVKKVPWHYAPSARRASRFR
jgi:hypothetical protein